MMTLTNKFTNTLKGLLCLVLITSILSGIMCINAEDPYEGYNYNYYGEASAPNGFLPTEVFNGEDLGVGYFNSPTDMYVDAHDNIFILDSGNGRVIKLDSDFNVLNVISEFTYNGEPSPLDRPQGICVTPDGEIYICDTYNSRVIVVNEEGIIDRTYGKPITELISSTLEYLPLKIEVTATGDMYVIVDNIVDGAVIITDAGEFLGFFATDAVTITAEAIKVIFWRMIMTDEQIKRMMSLQPVPFDNMCLDGDFLYTSTTYRRELDQIRKVNPAGTNLFAGNEYGESYSNSGAGDFEQAAFCDVEVDENGFFYGLDQSFRKVFVYNQNSELLMIFGGEGYTEGLFYVPTAIETVNGKVLITDRNKNMLTVFEPTYYGQQIMLGSQMYDHGRYEEAIGPWYEVLKLNVNSELAYRGIARAEYLSGDYVSAMEHYAAAYDRDGYSEARQKHRSQIISKNFSWYVSALILIFVALYVLSKYKSKIYAKIGYQTLAETGYAGMKKWKYPFYNLLHPYDGMNEMRYNKKESLPLAVFFAFAWYASMVIIRQYEDYILNNTNKNDINIFMILATTIGLLLIGCISNWAITTLVDGKGSFKNVFIYCSYAMIPTTIATLIVTVMSHYIILTETFFANAILFIGYAWTAVLIFIGLQTVHDFTTKKTILMVLLTLVGMLVILFLMMLLVVLYSEVASFVTTIIFEIIYKFAV